MDRSLTLNDRDAPSTFKYIAVLPHVREIALVGTADLAFWKDRLAEVDLFPLDFRGQARVPISAIESRFLGVRFREISITVFARRDDGDGGQEGLFLALAFNSSRFFAAIERAVFSTPYRHGRIRVDTSPTPSSPGASTTWSPTALTAGCVIRSMSSSFCGGSRLPCFPRTGSWPLSLSWY
jgi:hypothetical protein